MTKHAAITDYYFYLCYLNFVNLKKCELFRVSDLSSFPPSIQTSTNLTWKSWEHLLVMLNFADNSSLVNIKQH